MALITLSKETRQISSLTAEINILTRSKSTLKHAISKIDLSILLISNYLQIPTSKRVKIRRIKLRIIMK
jgi:hypothetical protein